eukprot:scaffold395_cov243-Pinguiococcus_pyrenoidosus.AAC.6
MRPIVVPSRVEDLVGRKHSQAFLQGCPHHGLNRTRVADGVEVGKPQVVGLRVPKIEQGSRRVVPHERGKALQVAGHERPWGIMHPRQDASALRARRVREALPSETQPKENSIRTSLRDSTLLENRPSPHLVLVLLRATVVPRHALVGRHALPVHLVPGLQVPIRGDEHGELRVTHLGVVLLPGLPILVITDGAFAAAAAAEAAIAPTVQDVAEQSPFVLLLVHPLAAARGLPRPPGGHDVVAVAQVGQHGRRPVHAVPGGTRVVAEALPTAEAQLVDEHDGIGHGRKVANALSEVRARLALQQDMQGGGSLPVAPEAHGGLPHQHQAIAIVVQLREGPPELEVQRGGGRGVPQRLQPLRAARSPAAHEHAKQRQQRHGGAVEGRETSNSTRNGVSFFAVSQRGRSQSPLSIPRKHRFGVDTSLRSFAALRFASARVARRGELQRWRAGVLLSSGTRQRGR